MRVLHDKALILVLLLSCLIAASEAEIWASLIALTAIFVRVIIEFRGWRPLSKNVVGLFALLAGVCVYLKFRTLVSRDASLNLLLCLVGLKLLDFRVAKDKRFLLLLTMLLNGLKPMYSIDIYWMLPILGSYFLGLYSLMRDSKLEDSFSYLLKIVLVSIPGMVFLFFFFPRVVLPWANWYGSSQMSGMMGFSNQLSPGNISSLKNKDELVFRARIQTGRNAKDSVRFGADLYWRGGVLVHPHGFSWSQSLSRKLDSRNIKAAGASQINYSIVLEPYTERVLFGLDRPINLRASNEEDIVQNTASVYEYVHDLTTAFAYEGLSYLEYHDDVKPKPEELEVASSNSPRLEEFIAKIKKEHITEREQIDFLKEFFSKGGFTYTLEPGSYGRGGVDEFLFVRKKGFCEHYASSYAYLARLLGIPSRVVVGFQGGDYNVIGDFWRISTKNAHAWAEVYVGNEWQRQDPTSWVEGFSAQATAMGLTGLNGSSQLNKQRFGFLGVAVDYLENWIDNMNYRWTRFLIDFDFGSQESFWQSLKALFRLEYAWKFVLLILLIGIIGRVSLSWNMGLKNANPFHQVLCEISNWSVSQGRLPREESETPIRYLAALNQKEKKLGSVLDFLIEELDQVLYASRRQHKSSREYVKIWRRALAEVKSKAEKS